MHGELLKVRCIYTNKIVEWNKDITPKSKCFCCNLTDSLRPHIVWFGETPLYIIVFANIPKIFRKHT